MSTRATSNIPSGVSLITDGTYSKKITVTASSNLCELWSDNGIWDTVANVFVKPEATNYNTWY